MSPILISSSVEKLTNQNSNINNNNNSEPTQKFSSLENTEKIKSIQNKNEKTGNKEKNKSLKSISFTLSIKLFFFSLLLILILLINFFQPTIKKINFLGDSITKGFPLKNVEKECFTSIIRDKLNIITNSYAVNGARIARQDDNDKFSKFDFNKRVKNIDPTADFTFVFGGTNDYGHGKALIGNINDDSLYTFYGAMKNLVKELLKIFKNKRICFIIPLPRFNENDPLGEGRKDKNVKNFPLSEYRKIMKEICILNKIEYLDVCDKFPIPPKKKSKYFVDGLHLNAKGHELLAELIIKYLKKKELVK